MATVFLNGKFVDRDEAVVSAFDAGFQHGVGLFETMLAVGGGEWRVLHLRQHLQRLSVSAKGLGLSESLRVAALEEAVIRTVARAGEELEDVSRLRVRLTITGGDLNMLGRARGANSSESGQPHPGPPPGGEGDQGPTLLIVAQPATEYPAEMFERGVSAVVADLRVNPLDPFSGHKTLNYWARLRELQVAASKRAGEALVFQVTNHLAGGCVSNAFVVRGGTVYTPIARGEESEVAEGGGAYTAAGLDPHDSATPAASAGDRGAVLPSPVLPGIVRRWVMDWCAAEGIEVERRMLTIDDVLGAEEVFLTNSSWGVLPVVKVEREAVGDGSVGEMSRRLMGAWGELVGSDNPWQAALEGQRLTTSCRDKGSRNDGENGPASSGPAMEPKPYCRQSTLQRSATRAATPRQERAARRELRFRCPDSSTWRSPVSQPTARNRGSRRRGWHKGVTIQRRYVTN